MLSGPVFRLCREALWEVKTRQLSQALMLEGVACQAEAMGFDPDFLHERC